MSGNRADKSSKLQNDSCDEAVGMRIRSGVGYFPVRHKLKGARIEISTGGKEFENSAHGGLLGLAYTKWKPKLNWKIIK